MANANFSGMVRLADLNDYIAPSQACAVNLSGSKISRLPDDIELPMEVPLQVRAPPPPGGGFKQVTTDDGAVKVSLNDCLACSGCVTSAETVLLEQQSTKEFLAKVADSELSTIVSISPQSRASLAEHYKITPREVFQKITSFFKEMGVVQVYDTSCSRDLSLMESAAEFIWRYRTIAATGEKGAPTVTEPHACMSPMSTGAPGGHPVLPMLASACPGWVCYAEKTHAHALPHISTAKSPMAVMGAIVKRLMAHQLGLQPDKVCHVSVMPCYDKKLEASREDLSYTAEAGSVAEIDLVLTTGEVLGLLQEKGVELPSIPTTYPIDVGLSSADPSGQLYTALPGGSGGYLEAVYRQAAEELFGQEVPQGPLEMRTLRNSDFKEISLEIGGEKVLNFASVYGFRNIQNLVRKIKSGKCDYHFIEIMACPAGCLNGGGQIKPAEGRSPKELLEEVERAYHHETVAHRPPSANPVVERLYGEWLEGCFSPKAHEVLHTRYHEREDMAKKSINW